MEGRGLECKTCKVIDLQNQDLSLKAKFFDSNEQMMLDLDIFDRILAAQNCNKSQKKFGSKSSTEYIAEITAKGVYNLKTKESFKVKRNEVSQRFTREDGSAIVEGV